MEEKKEKMSVVDKVRKIQELGEYDKSIGLTQGEISYLLGILKETEYSHSDTSNLYSHYEDDWDLKSLREENGIESYNVNRYVQVVRLAKNVEIVDFNCSGVAKFRGGVEELVSDNYTGFSNGNWEPYYLPSSAAYLNYTDEIPVVDCDVLEQIIAEKRKNEQQKAIKKIDFTVEELEAIEKENEKIIDENQRKIEERKVELVKKILDQQQTIHEQEQELSKGAVSKED